MSKRRDVFFTEKTIRKNTFLSGPVFFWSVEVVGGGFGVVVGGSFFEALAVGGKQKRA